MRRTDVEVDGQTQRSGVHIQRCRQAPTQFLPPPRLTRLLLLLPRRLGCSACGTTCRAAKIGASFGTMQCNTGFRCAEPHLRSLSKLLPPYAWTLALLLQMRVWALHRYLAVSGCAGMCVNMCKSPTQSFFTEQLGMCAVCQAFQLASWPIAFLWLRNRLEIASASHWAHIGLLLHTVTQSALIWARSERNSARCSFCQIVTVTTPPLLPK